MALFIAGLAFTDSLIDSAKLGIFLASVFSAGAGVAVLMWVPTAGITATVPRGQPLG
jgi:NhaA family Na+:H+ antiporter